MYFNSKIIGIAQKTDNVKICSMQVNSEIGKDGIFCMIKTVQTYKRYLFAIRGKKHLPFFVFKIQVLDCLENFTRFIYNKLNCWNSFAETSWPALLLYVPALLSEIHIQWEWKNCQYLISDPYFSTCSYSLQYLWSHDGAKLNIKNC